jgi:hypothetical protein
MMLRLIALIGLTLAVPLGATAQVAHATAPAQVTHAVAAPHAPAHVAASAVTHEAALVAHSDQDAASPAHAPETPAPAQAPTHSRPAARAEAQQQRAEARQEIVEARLEAMKQRNVEEAAERQSKGINVRIEATVIESKGEQVTGRKTLTLTLVDGEAGSVRSMQVVHRKGMAQYKSAPLNMDAKAFMRADGRVKVGLTLEYQGGGSQDESQPSATETLLGDPLDGGIKQTVVVVLESGKPLIVAQSADAVGDRRVALEVKATVLK